MNEKSERSDISDLQYRTIKATLGKLVQTVGGLVAVIMPIVDFSWTPRQWASFILGLILTTNGTHEAMKDDHAVKLRDKIVRRKERLNENRDSQEIQYVDRSESIATPEPPGGRVRRKSNAIADEE